MLKHLIWVEVVDELELKTLMIVITAEVTMNIMVDVLVAKEMVEEAKELKVKTVMALKNHLTVKLQ